MSTEYIPPDESPEIDPGNEPEGIPIDVPPEPSPDPPVEIPPDQPEEVPIDDPEQSDRRPSKCCKWWQIEPDVQIQDTTAGFCIDEKLLQYRLRVGGNSGRNRYAEEGEPVHRGNTSPVSRAAHHHAGARGIHRRSYPLR